MIHGSHGGTRSCIGIRRPPASVRLEPVTVRGRPLATGDRVRGATVSTPPLRKLLFSATLTSNPQKLAGLDVVNPLIYTARERRTRATTAGVAGGGERGAGREGGVGGDDDEAKRPSQETRRSNLDDVGVDGKRSGRYSTPATLQETYTVCDSHVSLGLGVGGGGGSEFDDIEKAFTVGVAVVVRGEYI